MWVANQILKGFFSNFCYNFFIQTFDMFHCEFYELVQRFANHCIIANKQNIIRSERKMVPVCVARHLSQSTQFLCCFYHIDQNVNSLLVYNCQTVVEFQLCDV